MKSFAITLLLILVMYSCSPILSTNVQFKSDLIKPVNNQIHKIKIVGFGSNPTRQFLDDLAIQIIKDLNKAGVATDYSFLSEDVSLQYYKDSNYNAILVLEPSGIADLKSTTNRFEIRPPITGNSTRISNSEISFQRYKLNQNFYFSLYKYEKPISKAPMWDAVVRINADPAKKGLYKFISKKIIESFQNNDLIK